MKLGSKSISLLFSLIVSGVASGVLYFFAKVDSNVLQGTVAIIFFLSFLSIKLGLDFLFYREISKVYQLFTSVTAGEDIKETAGVERKLFFNEPLKNLNDDILNYAESKQGEIEDLKRMETFRREFMADVSHELKTPIFSAQGFIHTLMDGAVNDKKVRGRFLEKAANSLDGLDALVQDLLTISQMEAGEIKMDFYVFDVVKLVKEIFEQLEEKAEERKITLGFDKKFIGDPVFVYADNRRIEQVLRNLIINGISYSKKEGGNVVVYLEEKSNKVKVSVKDEGLGISKEDQARIFGRFYRVEKSRARIKGGTGLGLSIVKHIVEAHGSLVSVTSTINKGSTFSFSLDKGDRMSSGKRG